MQKKSINADILDNYMLTDNITISEEIDRVICSKFKKMILKTGKPFSMVSNQDMKSVLRFLGSRQDLSIKCGMIAQKVKAKIKYLLITSSFISISVDEWSDFNKKRYLGNCQMHPKWKHFNIFFGVKKHYIYAYKWRRTKRYA